MISLRVLNWKFHGETGIMSPWLTRVRLFSSPGSYSFECSRPRGHGEPKCLLPKRITETDEELYSGNECLLRAKALLTHLKDPVDYMTIKSTVIDYGDTPFLPGDKVHVTLPTENVSATTA